MSRSFPGQRALHVVVRTAHIGAAGVTLGAVTLGADPALWPLAAGITGALLVLDDVYKYDADWFRWLQSHAILAKLGLLWLGTLRPEWLPAALWGALALGGLISHAPGRIRQAALWGPPGPCALGATRVGSSDGPDVACPSLRPLPRRA
jgi:hypothetical protein